MSKKDTQLTVPSPVLNQLSENSPAGFVLFVINKEGKPEIFSLYDSDVSALAIHKFILLWANAVQEMHEDAIMDIVYPSREEPPEDNQ